MARLLKCQINFVDGEYYDKSLVDAGLMVCERCKHAHMPCEGKCVNCGSEAPSPHSLSDQWGVVVDFDLDAGKVRHK